MNKQIYIYIIMLLFLPQIRASNILFEHIDIKSGLSNNTVNSVYQDEKGIVWIATRNGLNRYSQSGITVFKPIMGDTIGLFGNNIQEVTGDGKGHLYMQCLWGLLEYNLENHQFKRITTKGIMSISYGEETLWASSWNRILKYNKATNQLETFFSFGEDIGLTVLKEHRGKIYAGSRQGLYAIDKKTAIASKMIDQVDVVCIYTDSKDNVWLGTSKDGLYKIETTGEIKTFVYNKNDKNSLTNNFVRGITEDHMGNYWIGTANGLNFLTQDNQMIGRFYHVDTDYNSIASSSIWNIMTDEQGTLWIGTFYGGVSLLNPELTHSEYFRVSESELSYPVVGKIVEDEDSNLWIATDGGGLNFMDRKHKTFKSYQSTSAPNTISSNIIKDIVHDKNHACLWVGTHHGGLNKFDLKTKQVKRYTLPPRLGVGRNDIRSIKLHNDLLYIGTRSSLIVFDPKTEHGELLIKEEVTGGRQIWDMMVDSSNRLWFSTSVAIFNYSLDRKVLSTYTYDKRGFDYLGENYQNVFYQDQSQQIWIGSAGSGLFKYNAEADKIVPVSFSNNENIDNYILNIDGIQDNKLVITTNKSFSIFDTQENTYLGDYTNELTPLTSINERGLCVTRDNDIVIGGYNGMIILKNSGLNLDNKKFSINLIDLWIDNKKIEANDGSGVLSKSLTYTDKIELKYNHSSISIDFVETNYIKRLKNELEYTMDGFDQKWISVGEGNTISYTNLSPGKYTLKIRSVNKQAERALMIVVHPPLYATWYAYLFYFIVILSLVTYLMQNYSSRIKLQTSLEYANREKQQIERLNQTKLRFFTNVSHELRTPVTLIISQIEMILDNRQLPDSIKHSIVSISNNIKKMQHLLNEILDFRKQEQGFLEPKVQHLNLVNFLKEVCSQFEEYAQRKEISLKFESTEDDIQIWIDPMQMEKVFSNLLNNSFKFTPQGGEIKMIVEKKGDSVEIIVSDTGIGIDNRMLENIFERFYQVDNEINSYGTGIGLSLAKGIVESHKGSIRVESEKGVGSQFIVSLLLTEENIGVLHELQSDEKQAEESSPFSDPSIDLLDNYSLTEGSEKPIILIVEDNKELLETLVKLFSPFYQVLHAMNGQDGFDIALDKQPDLVLSDVMMPVMSGIELCKKLKTNFNTTHIPVVLLTARTASAHTIEGLNTGADDYIVKPFSNSLLIARCNNIINNRKMIQAKFSKDAEIKTDLVAVNVVDQELLDKTIEIIEANITNSQFDVNFLAESLNLGRTNLFTKIKGITGQTPNEYIMSIRLKKSIYLLEKHPELNISDVAFQTGFNEPAYFSKCFKNTFGETPLNYRKRIIT